MTWTVWDFLVIAGVVLQLAALGYLVYAILQLKNGAIAKVLQRAAGVANTGSGLAEASLHAVERNQGHVLGTVESVGKIANAVHRDRFALEGFTINYRTLFTTLATLRTVRGYAGQVNRFVRRKSMPPPPGPGKVIKAARVRRSIPDRLGLVPPAAKHLGRAMPTVRFLMGVVRELRQRGVI
jgi:hypothetical protein